MAAQPTPPRALPRSKRTLTVLGAAVLAAPLLLVPSVAHAESFAPADAVAAIANDDYLPDFQREFIDAVDSDAIWNHPYRLSHEIGPRVAGSAGEDAAVAYVQGLLDSYGFATELETFTARSSNFADITPSRYTDEFASWQFRPAANGVFTGADAPVTGEVIDIGAVTADLAERTDLAGRVVVADWIASAGTRNALLADLKTAGAAAVVLVQTSTSESLPNPGNLPAALTDMVVVTGASNQGKRIRTLLEGGPLTLSITTEQSRDTSTNVIGVRPAANGDPNAPIVYIGAHIDSVVGSPGASDNGSGTSIMLDLARILGQYSLDTEIRVGAWGAEEVGIVGSKHHVSTMTQEEIDRTIGAWNMDMAGTSFAGNPGQEFGFWALTVDGDTAADNVVLGLADEVSNIAGYGDLQIGQVGRSDHQSFRDVGIEAAVFSWMFWAGGTNIVLEPAYHMTTDTLEFVSQERMGIAAEVLGGAAFRAALNEVDVDVTDEHGDPAVGAEVAMSCEGDEGWRGLGVTGDTGAVVTHVPHISCDFVAMAANGARGSALDVPFTGDGAVSIALQFDDEAPVVEFSADPAAAATGWHLAAPLTVSLAAADDADDAPVLEYSLDGVAWNAYTEGIAFAEDGVHTLYARATDDFGNSSGPVSEAFRIDTVSPTLSVSADPSNRGRVSISAFDATSGVASVEYRVGAAGDWTALEPPAGGWSGASTAQVKLDNGAVQLQFRAVDAAGHSSSIGSLSFAAVPGASLSSTGAETALPAVAALAAVLLAAGGALFALRRRRVPTGGARE